MTRGIIWMLYSNWRSGLIVTVVDKLILSIFSRAFRFQYRIGVRYSLRNVLWFAFFQLLLSLKSYYTVAICIVGPKKAFFFFRMSVDNSNVVKYVPLAGLEAAAIRGRCDSS